MDQGSKHETTKERKREKERHSGFRILDSGLAARSLRSPPDVYTPFAAYRLHSDESWFTTCGPPE